MVEESLESNEEQEVSVEFKQVSNTLYPVMKKPGRPAQRIWKIETDQ
ncbi:hypothetical protein BWQ96_09582 [Gracilariopsis chorda]|uniref:Uncharacterized protein n=1 Tax=Gracilariopsis chorda TaxID=448386 RepID=A0A2V3IF59_9FLOR|nr:hypothetical protein BWQ96_09582 [Gracilariopsis chorda]|eukprot:PXF40704.1 hypothetical protein BWQ96_09582 [Gracilariopsis chorda]